MRSIVKGASVTIQATVYLDQAKTIIANITGATIIFIAKRRADDLDTAVLFSKSVGSGITIILAAAGRCDVVLLASDTNALVQKQMYYEVVVRLADGVTFIRNGVKEIQLLGNVIKVLP